jgi:hypothetical protein
MPCASEGDTRVQPDEDRRCADLQERSCRKPFKKAGAQETLFDETYSP